MVCRLESQQCCPQMRWSRQRTRIGNIAVVKAHPILGDAVHVRCMIDPRAVGTDGLGRVVISARQPALERWINPIYDMMKTMFLGLVIALEPC